MRQLTILTLLAILLGGCVGSKTQSGATTYLKEGESINAAMTGLQDKESVDKNQWNYVQCIATLELFHCIIS